MRSPLALFKGPRNQGVPLKRQACTPQTTSNTPRRVARLCRPNRRATTLTLIGQFLIIAKVEDHDIRAPILGMGRVVAIYRRIPVLAKATSNLHDPSLFPDCTSKGAIIVRLTGMPKSGTVPYGADAAHS